MKHLELVSPGAEEPSHLEVEFYRQMFFREFRDGDDSGARDTWLGMSLQTKRDIVQAERDRLHSWIMNLHVRIAKLDALSSSLSRAG